MKTVLDILQKAGGWHHGLHIHIDNPPYIALVLEAVDESGPCGLPALSVCHYGEQNGDAMRDPEMLFDVSRWGLLTPYYWRNDYVAVEQWSRFIKDDHYCYHTELATQHEAFAKTWDRNLRQQGFADVFDPQKHRRTWPQVTAIGADLQSSADAPQHSSTSPKEGICRTAAHSNT